VTKPDVREFVKSQSARQVLAARPQYDGKVVASKLNERWAADLIDYTATPSKADAVQDNNPYNYILIAQDIYSRKLYGVALREKTRVTVTQAFEDLVREADAKPEELNTDQGPEFEGPFEEYLAEENIAHATSDLRNFNARGTLDSAIRSFKQQLTRIQVAEKTRDWASLVQRAIKAYNNLSHTGIMDATPNEVPKDEELQLADCIIVPSSYSRLSLQICPFELAPIIVVPYGMPKVCDLLGGGSSEKKGVLKVLFVGGLTQLKGLSYLFDAAKILGSIVRLTIIGRMPSLNCTILNKSLECHRWISSLPHEQILGEMRNHDVLVLPSLSDGFGMVVTEALSQGVPVITTPHSCGSDVITNDVDGFIVPIRSAESIAEKLEILYNNRAKLAEMHVAALRKAKERNWSSYRSSISRTVSSIIHPPDLKNSSQKLSHGA
jgi:glycosyltransferase involved in cell wall biosynthesis